MPGMLKTVTRTLIIAIAGLALAATSLSGVAEDDTTLDYNPLKNPYFGQTHQHTGWSFDATIYSVTLGPENAYRYARGERV